MVSISNPFFLTRIENQPVFKNSQTISDEFVESFDEFWENRYSQSQTNGSYSRWDYSVSNGLYSFDKWEDTSTFDNSGNSSIVGGNYEIVLKCADLTNVSNQYCDGVNLQNSTIGIGGEFLTGWAYRKEITITGSSDGDLSNYLIDLWLFYESGTDTTINKSTKIYLNELSQTDFDDIRFTDSTGGTGGLLDHYLSQKYNSNYTTAIVQVPSILRDSNQTTIYLYYGNPSASDSSDSSILTFFDDFEDPTTTSDSSKWYSNTGSPSVSERRLLDGNWKWVLDTTAGGSGTSYAQIIWNNSALQHFDSDAWKIFMDVSIRDHTGTTTGLQITWKAGTDTIYQSPYAFGGRPRYYRHNTGYIDHVPIIGGGNGFITNNMDYHMKYFQSTSSNNANRGAWEWSNTTYHVSSVADRLLVDAGSYNSPLERVTILLDPEETGQFTDSDLNFYFDNFIIINKTHVEPTYTIGESTLGLNYVGWVNNSDQFIGGVNRFFPAVNVSEIQTLQDAGATVPQFEYFNFTTNLDNSYLATNSAIELFLYTYNESEVLENTTLSGWSSTQLQEFWNITSQPNLSKIWVKSFNFTDINGIFSFDLTSLANYWHSNRNSGDTVIGIGMQLFDLDQETGKNVTAKEESDYILLSGYFAFDYLLQVDYSDIASNSLSVQIEPDEEIISSVAFSYEKGSNSNLTQANLLTYEIAIETCSICANGDLSKTHFIRAILYDSSGDVYISWRNIQGSTVSYDTGVTLEDNKNYRFTFEISKTDGRLTFSILDSSGDQVLRPKTWNSFTSDEVTNRPSFFGSKPLLENWSGNTSRGDHRRGYSITLKASSNEIVTGDTSFNIDQLYSSSGLLYTDWYCREESNNPLNTCTYGSLQDFDDLDAYTAHWYNLSTSTRGTFENNIKDFRSFSGIVQINSTDTFSSDQYVESIRILTELEPIYENGSLGNSLTTSLTISNYTGGYNVLGSASDNISIPFWYPDLPGGKANVNFGFGYYFVDERTIGLTVKYFDTGISTSVPVVATTYGNYDEEITQDVNIIIQYEIDFGNNYNTDGGVLNFRETDIRRGRNLPFEIPSIPNPDVPYVPPSLLDDIFNGLVGFTNTLLSGDIFGALGGVWDSILNLLGGIGGFFVSALFDFIIPWIQSGILLIWNWFVNVTNTKSFWDLIYSLFNLVLLSPVLIWLFLVFLNIGFPFLYGLAGSPESAPQRIIEGIEKTWMFDASFGLASAVVPRIPLILVTIILTFIFGSIYEISVIETINPF